MAHVRRNQIACWSLLLLPACAAWTLSACGDSAADDAANAGASNDAGTKVASGSGGSAVPPKTGAQAGSTGAGSGGHTSGAAGSGGSTVAMMKDASQPAANGADAAQPNTGADGGASAGVATLFWLEISGNAVWRANADGTDKQSLISGHSISTPDGVAVDLDSDGGHVYWTNMGSLLGGGGSGTLQRARLDGTEVETIVPAGSINTPKQMTIDHVHHKLYFCDREGAKVWRANLDGSELEILVSGHGVVQLVGIALDVPREQFYFTDRMAKKIYRAGFAMPSGEKADTRTDLEELFSTSADAMPIDLDLDLGARQIYWTDRVEGKVHRASMDLPAGKTPSTRSDVETLADGVTDSIGVSLDLEKGLLYFAQLNGTVWRANLDGSEREMVAHTGSASGVALVRVPAM